MEADGGGFSETLGRTPDWLCENPVPHHWDTCPRCLRRKASTLDERTPAMSNNSEMNFDDIVVAEVPVAYGGKRYILREASADAVVRWRNALLKSTKLGPEGKPSSIDGMADTEPYLVSMCLFEVKEDGKEISVPTSTIRTWPNKVMKALFEKVKSISDLDEQETIKTLEEKMTKLRVELDKKRDAEDDLKNLPSATTGGSV